MADDRFPRNAEQIAAKYRGDLLRAVAVLEDALIVLSYADRSRSAARGAPVDSESEPCSPAKSVVVRRASREGTP